MGTGEISKKKFTSRNKGRKQSVEHIKKRAIQLLGKKRNAEQRKRMSIAAYNRSPEFGEMVRKQQLKRIENGTHNNYKDGISKKPGYKSSWAAQRRAKIRGAGGSFTVGDWDLLKKQYNYKCPACGLEEPEIKLTIDHIIPVSKGGSNNIENIQPLCKHCNLKKWTKIIKF